MSLVFLNKFLMNYAVYEFPYPLAITWYQFVVAWACLFAIATCGRQTPYFSFVPPYEFDWSRAKQVVKLTVVYLLMIIFNNLCLKYVEVSFYQVARSLTIFFSLALPYLMYGQKTSGRAIIACLIVVLGFILGSGGEVKFSWSGVLYGVASSFFVALYGIMIQVGLKTCNGDEWRLMMYNTPMATFMLLPVIAVSNESDVMSEVETLSNMSFWFWMTVAAVLGFLINIAMFLQVKYTSPLTNTISGTAKAGLQTLLGIAIFRNPVSSSGALGILLCLAGSGYYSWVRYEEKQERIAREKEERSAKMQREMGPTGGHRV